jgi:hypothetical protein
MASVKRLFDIGFWARALRNPIVLTGLAVDLAPVYAVLAWGWSATPLVLVYWTENVISGVMTLPRIFISGANYGAKMMGISLFLCAFFVVHYGLFCAVHGTFLMVFAVAGDAMHGAAEPGAGLFNDVLMNIPAMIGVAISSGMHVDWLLEAMVAWQVVVFIWEFILKGGWKRTNPMAEMFAPYGRIIILHFGLFAGFGALLLLGQPMVGVLGLILFRAIYGVLTNDRQTNPMAASEQAASDSFNGMIEKMRIAGKPPT